MLESLEVFVAVAVDVVEGEVLHTFRDFSGIM
jgi:hypothetical protein